MKPNNLRVKGLTKRWLFEIIGVVVVIVAVIQVICSILIYNYYYNSVRQNIELRISRSLSFMTNYAGSSDLEFEQGAKEFIYDYSDKNVVEVQIFNKSGKIIVSTRGFIPEQQEFEDYNAAIQSPDRKAEWIGKTSEGEKVMAVTSLFSEVNGESVGAIRYIVSMEQIDYCIWYNIFMLFSVCLFVIAITVVSGVIFLRSILLPIRAITDTAFSIASGNFNDRLPVSSADEMGKLCDTINYMATELAGAEKMKNDFISSVSHELRTPLTVIKGWGETIKGSIGSDPRLLEKGINVIIGETERLSGLVEDLLDFSKMQSGRLQFNKQRIDILAELGEAVYMYEETAKKQGVTIEYVEPEMLPPVMADANRLKQVFINILDNAIKYSGEGGQILVEASQHDIYVQVTIKDTGCGIAAEDLNKVKDKFYKANTTVRGSGIGLAIADEIIKQHDGILVIDSKQGAGTTVSIALPFIQ